MGLGFQRGRKYDTDMDRLGRMETAQSELRKTGELNMQKELRNLKKSMATYSIKRFSRVRQKEYGLMGDVGNGVRDAAGGIVKGAGSLLDNGVTKTAATIGGIGLMGKGAALGAKVGSLAGPIGTMVGGIGGALLAPLAARKTVEVAGKGLKSVGESIQS